MNCKICDKKFDKVQYSKPYDEICSSECFTENFWFEKIEALKEFEKAFIIIDGKCYKKGDEDTSIYFKGFDGRLFKFRFLDEDTIIESTNMWYNGIIPKKFREQLQDNAVWIK